MRENRLKAKWRTGEPTFGAWLAIPNALVAEAVAQAGFDYLCIDMQHGLADYSQAVAMLQAISTTDCTPIVRVPWNEPGIIGRMLDAGAMGIVIPMVNSVEEARAATGACRYHPAGYRSFGPIRAMVYAGGDYYEHANDEIACIPMIETRRAIDDLDAILDVPGIDAVYIGPADLAITYEVAPGVDNPDPDYQKGLATVVSACRTRGIVAGIHSNAQVAPTRAVQGFQMITASSDFGAVTSAMRRELAQARKGEAAEGAKTLY
ncbi:MAG: 4-hydroxy-2-oxoheptanedioate aldolase [Acidimicrobiia bacterium]|jgi:4-hydroxy-2-oxoheptanedioate aldolase|nr:4-hydroxy-2-oxoheptanedioate aldolase [Acidimicrobiia bacterium]